MGAGKVVCHATHLELSKNMSRIGCSVNKSRIGCSVSTVNVC